MTARRALFLGLLCWGLYVSLRTWLQRLLPAADWPSYARQDVAITVLRASCAAACFFIATRRWRGAALGMGSRQLGGHLAWVAAILLVASMLMETLAQASTPGLWHIRVLEAGIALVVAANEEIGFRGLFYCAARELWGRAAAVAVTSIAFTAMHAGYQPGFHTYKIFAIGLALGLLRDRGAGLPALIALHFVLDTPSALLLSGDLQSVPIYNASTAVAGFAALAMLFQKDTPLPGPGTLIFTYGSLKRMRWGAREMKLENRADWLGPALAKGDLYSLGDYPGACEGGGLIRGELWRLRDSEMLPMLDRFEGDEFLRDEIEVEGRKAWAWLLKKRPEGPAIESGEW